MSSGATLNVVISIGLYPIVTRIFTKEQFGGLGLYIAVVGLISLAGTSLYPSGLVIPKFRRDFYRLLKLSLNLTAVTVASTIFIILFFRGTFVSIFKLETLNSYVYLIPIGVALACLKDISTNWNVRNKDFKKNALSSVTYSGSQKAINISHGLTFGSSLIGLIITDAISSIIAILSLGVGKLVSSLGILRRISIKESLSMGRKYKRYPLNLLPGNLLNKYTADLPIYMLTAYFSPAITGAFVLANTILNIPLNVIGNSISSVFLQRATELYRTDPREMAQFAYQTNRKMLFLGVLVFGILFSFGDIIFLIAFGKKWTIAGKFAGILSTYFVFKLISSPMTQVFRVVAKEHYSLYVSSILVVGRIIGIYLGIIANEPVTAIVYFATANLIGYLITYMFVFKACNLPVGKSVIEVLTIIIIGFSLFHGIRYGLEQVVDIRAWLV